MANVKQVPPTQEDANEAQKVLVTFYLPTILSGAWTNEDDAPIIIGQLHKLDKFMRKVKASVDETLREGRAVNPEYLKGVEYFRAPTTRTKKRPSVSIDSFV